MNVLHKIKINDLASKFHFSVNNFETATTLKIYKIGKYIGSVCARNYNY